MDLAVIFVGINGWEQWTLPAIKSAQEHDPDARLIVVDNGSSPHYPATDGVSILQLPEIVSYTQAINKGVQFAGDADWYLILNNDVRFKAPCMPIIEGLDDSFVYGRQIIEGHGYRWLGLWLALIPRKVWEAVGEFDENFKMCGFDDADYCVRAKQLGIDTLRVPLDIHHYWGKTRWGLLGYSVARIENIEYFYKKHGWKPDDYRVIAE